MKAQEFIEAAAAFILQHEKLCDAGKISVEVVGTLCENLLRCAAAPGTNFSPAVDPAPKVKVVGSPVAGLDIPISPRIQAAIREANAKGHVSGVIVSENRGCWVLAFLPIIPDPARKDFHLCSIMETCVRVLSEGALEFDGLPNHRICIEREAPNGQENTHNGTRSGL